LHVWLHYSQEGGWNHLIGMDLWTGGDALGLPETECPLRDSNPHPRL
jgi:hypothetical protein